MTSNVGAKLIAKSGAGTLGFAPSSGETADDKKIREAVMGELKNVFRPEFLNRVDDIIVFRQLTQTDIDEIARRMLAGLSKRIAELDLKVEFAESAVSEIGKEGFDPIYGARPLRRAIQQRIEDKLSEQMLEGRFSPIKNMSANTRAATLSLRQKNDEQLKGRSRKYGFAPIRRKMHVEKYYLSSAIIETIFFQKITIF